ncbi:cytochrome P450 [Auriculariales sp. MPI-PUGE-AT-0066]|nr:cytochrome P450 [Auriculariales sp. MPI-PUGE-AT-0066]
MERLLQRDVAVAGVVVLVSFFASRILWDLKLSPLARQRIPGPAIAAVTELWYFWRGVKLDRPMALDKLFKEYGPVVRIGPSRVAFLDIEAIHLMHRLMPFNKADFLAKMTFGGRPNTVSTNDPAIHAKFRRWHAPALRGAHLKKTAVVIIQQMDNLVQRFMEDGEDAAGIDVFHLMKIHTLDILGLAILDTKFDQIRTRQELPLAKNMANWLLDLMIRTALPEVVDKFLRLLPHKGLQEIFAADEAVCQLAGKLYDETPDEPTESENISVLAAGKWYRDPTTGETTTREEVIGDMGIFLIAGTDTTAVSLTYALYQLARLPVIYETLRAELKSAGMDGDSYDIDVLRGLPYFNAFIKEILRIHAPAGELLERVVPNGGTVLAGYSIPEGTTVGASSYASGMREDLFPNAPHVDPERWVKKTATGWSERPNLEKMNAAWHPFNLGVRACVGRPLAEIEQLLTITAVVRNFRIVLHETTTEDSMSPIDIAVIMPKAQKCLLRFIPNPLHD